MDFTIKRTLSMWVRVPGTRLATAFSLLCSKDYHTFVIIRQFNIMEKDNRTICNGTETTIMDKSVTLAYCIKLTNLCRICGMSSTDCIEIFDPKGIELKLKTKINMYMPIQVEADDLMPLKLCTNCCNKLDVIHSLVIACLKTDMRLKNLLHMGKITDYNNRYSDLVRECSLELAREICTVGPAQSMTQEGTQEGEQTIEDSHEFHLCLTDLGNNSMSHNNFTTEAGTDEICVLNQATVGMINTGDILCLHCRNTFKTQEIFENHKILCDEEGAILFEKPDETFSHCTLSVPQDTGTSRVQLKSQCKTFVEQQIEIPNQQVTTNNKDLSLTEEQLNNSHVVQAEHNKKCGHCEAVYSTKKELLNHINECHEGQILFKCFTCDKTYEKWSGLDVHEATHRIDKPYLCDLCGKRFKHSNNLRGHKRTHLEESKKKKHVCDMCGSAFRSRFHLREHMNQHEGNKPYNCEQCGKAFHKRIQLRQHKLSHGLNKHICPICGVSFNRRGNMTAHLKRHGEGYGTYTCSVCTHRFQTMSELKLHRKDHTKQDILESVKKRCAGKGVWECGICSRVFSKRAVLLYHERGHTANGSSVECDECGKKLSSQKSLRYHKKSIHSTERQHMCQYCGEAFVSNEAQLLHERIHTGERPYPCKVCNMRYKCSSNLNQHVKIHSGIRPHKCNFCNKTFMRKDALNVHERIHTGVRPFACVACGRKFSQKNDMLKHIKTHDAKPLRGERSDETFLKKKSILKDIVSQEQDASAVQEPVQVNAGQELYNVTIAP